VDEATMNALLPHALGVVGETFAAYEEMPFGLDESLFTEFAINQFQKRLARIEQARTSNLDEIMRTTTAVIEAEDA
jgi:ribonucleoside-diphosphate reductase beta chain